MTKQFSGSLFAFAVLLTANSCSKKEQCRQPTVTTNNVQGGWKHNYPTNMEGNFVPPERYHYLRFTDDSFYLKTTYTITDIAVPGCEPIEYRKGKFTIANNKLVLNGVYTESDYSLKTSTTCNHAGPFTRTYDVAFCDENLILSIPNSSATENYRIIRLLKE